MRLIGIPRTLHVIVPPLTSQYLNLTKTSSLAIAIGYMDIVATLGGITLNQTGKEMECMMLVLMIYLIISLLISAFMNWYNRRIALVERWGGGKDMADTTRAYEPGTHPSLPPTMSVDRKSTSLHSSHKCATPMTSCVVKKK